MTKEAAEKKEAYVTLVATDSYVPGALVLAHRLRDLGTVKHLACLVTPIVSSQARALLVPRFHHLISVDSMHSTTPANLLLLGRPDLAVTLTKLHVFRLAHLFTKIVFLDADTYPVKLIDELFERPSFSAAPDVGWPDCFNSGVFVVQPSDSVYADLIQLAAEKGSFDGGDQGLLNTYFASWPETSAHRLPFTYNTTPSAAYSYAPAYMEFRDRISIAHFIGRLKPWHYQRFADGSVFHNKNNNDHVQAWWDTWDKHYDKTSPASLLSMSQEKLQHHQGQQELKLSTLSNPTITMARVTNNGNSDLSQSPIWGRIASSAYSDNLSSIRLKPHQDPYHNHQKPNKVPEPRNRVTNSIPEDHARFTRAPNVTQTYHPVYMTPVPTTISASNPAVITDKATFNNITELSASYSKQSIHTTSPSSQNVYPLSCTLAPSLAAPSPPPVAPDKKICDDEGSASVIQQTASSDNNHQPKSRQRLLPQATGVAEATMLEFELDYNERYRL